MYTIHGGTGSVRRREGMNVNDGGMKSIGAVKSSEKTTATRIGDGSHR